MSGKVFCSFCGAKSEDHRGVLCASQETGSAICDGCIGIAVDLVIGHVQKQELKLHRCMQIMRCNDPNNARMKPLFIPLKTEYFDAFENGTKPNMEEYRVHGLRWNKHQCQLGREVVLSCGYGKQRRLMGFIVGFRVSDEPTKTEAWKDCYGDRFPGAQAACIKIAIYPKDSFSQANFQLHNSVCAFGDAIVSDVKDKVDAIKKLVVKP